MTTCLATPDRCEPGTMRCVCRLAWEVSDPHPPPCPARPHDYDKMEFTRELYVSPKEGDEN
jgi:hypothetical protein